MGNSGEIVACDINPRRLKQVQLLANRLGVKIIRAELANAENLFVPAATKQFTKVLLDAPCSGLGVLRRNPEGKWWKTVEEIKTLAGLQRRILENAASYVAPGGTLIYATCSTSVMENESVVNDFLSHHNDFSLDDIRELYPQFASLCSSNGQLRTWPHQHGMDGFFAARLRKQEKL
jgi:16S rRNA (cytosine967-C5)-methyltransferase